MKTSQWKIVASREIAVKLRDKAFLGSTAFMLLLVVSFPLLAGFLNGGPSQVAVTSPEGAAIVRAADAAGGDVEVVRVGSVPAAEDRVASGDADAALLPADGIYELVGNESVSDGLLASISAAASSQAMESNAAAAGVTPDELYEGVGVSERVLEPTDVPYGVVIGAQIGFAVIFYVTALSFGMVLSQSVVQEKESRVVEILRATMSPRSLLAGKIVGNTALALAQLGLIAVAGVAAAIVGGQRDLLADFGPALVWFLPFFVLSFVALAAIFAVAGSMSTRQEDLQSTTLPAQAILGLPFMLMVIDSERFMGPLSYVPIASSFAMPGRLASGQVEWWEPLASVGIVLIFTLALVNFAARMYDATLLQTQGAATWRSLITSRAEKART